MKNRVSPLTGTLEAALFMPGCARQFEGRVPAVWRSFLVPITIFPLTAALFISAHPSGAGDPLFSGTLLGMYALRLLIYMGLFLGVMFVLSSRLQRGRDFLRFVQAHNWLDLPAFLFSLPLCFGYMMGAYEWADIYPMLVMTTLYGYASLAYASARIFGVPLDLGITIAAFSLVLNQASLGAVKYTLAQAILWLV